MSEYWKNPPEENNPINYLTPNCWVRSGDFVNKIEFLGLKDNSILELGSGLGRNLAVLKYAGYSDVSGVEINRNAVALMHDNFPILQDTMIRIDSIQKVLFSLEKNCFDLVFTMATLEHIDYSFDFCLKEISRIAKKYIITVEDEKRNGPRHFSRNYKKIFEGLGFQQIKLFSLLGLGDCFKMRIFQRKGVRNRE